MGASPDLWGFPLNPPALPTTLPSSGSCRYCTLAAQRARRGGGNGCRQGREVTKATGRCRLLLSGAAATALWQPSAPSERRRKLRRQLMPHTALFGSVGRFDHTNKSARPRPEAECAQRSTLDTRKALLVFAHTHGQGSVGGLGQSRTWALSRRPHWDNFD